MTKDEIYQDINSEIGFNEKANAFEQNIRGLDNDTALMSQRIATATEPSGLIKLDSPNKKDHF